MRSNRRCPCRQCSYSPLLRIRNKPPRRAFCSTREDLWNSRCFEVRNCIGIENSSRFTVGERALKTLSDFNPHLSVARGQQQQYAGIIVLIAYAPFTRQSYRIAFNISAAEALNRDNYYLRLCLFVQLLAESLNGAFVLIGETRGKIVDEKVACGRRVIVLRLCGHFVVIGKAWGEKLLAGNGCSLIAAAGRAVSKTIKSETSSAPAPIVFFMAYLPKSTEGTVAASAVAVK